MSRDKNVIEDFDEKNFDKKILTKKILTKEVRKRRVVRLFLRVMRLLSHLHIAYLLCSGFFPSIKMDSGRKNVGLAVYDFEVLFKRFE